jgi:segregation and condensation protein A
MLELELEEDPVEMVVDLASRGEIDPWNIDIVAVTDKFLKRMEDMRKLNLRISGRALFYAATLLRMKADALETREEEEEIEPVPKPLESSFELPVERVMLPRVRRRSRRPVTLPELIEELRTAEEAFRKREIRKQKQKLEREERSMTNNEGLRLPREENMGGKIKKVAVVLDEKFASGDADVVLFSDLVAAMSNPSVKKSTKPGRVPLGHSDSPSVNRSIMVSTFLVLLFLATCERTIWLEQPSWNGEIYIKRRIDGRKGNGEE